MRSTAFFYITVIFFICAGSLFWLHICTDIGLHSYASTGNRETWLLSATLCSSSLCACTGIGQLLDSSRRSWLLPYIALALAGATLLILLLAAFPFKPLFWK